MANNINAVVITGNLTRDPELSQVGGGTSLCKMRIAINTRVKRGEQWEDKANYFDIAVFGKQADNCERYLSKGRPLAVTGRLDWNEWQDKDGNNRQGVSIIADNVQFLDDGKRDGTVASEQRDDAPPPTTSAPAASNEFANDEDIPF